MPDATATLDSALTLFHIARRETERLDALARQAGGMLFPAIDDTYVSLARQLVRLEDAVWRALASWPLEHIADLGELLTFFDHARIGCLTVRELMDAARRESIHAN